MCLKKQCTKKMKAFVQKQAGHTNKMKLGQRRLTRVQHLLHIFLHPCLFVLAFLPPRLLMCFCCVTHGPHPPLPSFTPPPHTLLHPLEIKENIYSRTEVHAPVHTSLSLPFLSLSLSLSHSPPLPLTYTTHVLRFNTQLRPPPVAPLHLFSTPSPLTQPKSLSLFGKRSNPQGKQHTRSSRTPPQSHTSPPTPPPKYPFFPPVLSCGSSAPLGLGGTSATFGFSINLVSFESKQLVPTHVPVAAADTPPLIFSFQVACPCDT